MTNFVLAPPTDPPKALDGSRRWGIRGSHVWFPWDRFEFQKRRIPVTEEASTGPSTQPKDDTSANIVRDTPSPTDAETGATTDKTNNKGDTEILNIGEKQGEDVADKVNLEEKTTEIDEGQAGSDRGKTPESRPPPERAFMEKEQAGPNPGQSHVALAGPDPEPMHDDFIATVYPQNLDAYTYSDQFFNDKPTEEEPDKANIETGVESIVTVLIHQASSSAHPLFTLVIDLTPTKQVSSTIQEQVFTVTTATTTTLPLPPPPQQQSITDSSLGSRVSTLEQRCADLEKKHKLQDQTTHALLSRIFTLELRDLPHKINQTVNEVVKEAVHVALQAPL
ncbi:hypothetical protein Tco_0905373 [Tanacetum coccineum]